VALAPTSDGRVAIIPFDSAAQQQTVTRAALPAAVTLLEAQHPRWVWDDTTRWYPPLLAAGARVDRCVDLRLCRTILRSSALTAGSALARADADAWDEPAMADHVADG